MPTSSARYIDAVTCPNCTVPLVTLYANEPWCGRCDWGLDRLAPDPGSPCRAS